MPSFSIGLLLVIIAFLADAAREQCEDTKILLSKCYGKDEYQWLVEVPKTKIACGAKRVPQPKPLPCNFACEKGRTFDQDTLNCKSCSPGSFSLGGGQEYTFSSLDQVNALPDEISLKTESLISSYENACKTKKLWQIKGNALQGDVQSNCIINFNLRFKLVRKGSITIEYSLPTSVVLGMISSRCDFDTRSDAVDDDDNDDEESESESMRTKSFKLPFTGYGVWKEKKIIIDSEGDYKLQLFTMGLNAFHFPFLIRSIVVEGTSSIQECIPCPPGTSASESGAAICKPCKANTYAADEGSTECSPCNTDTHYSDEGSTACLPRPICGKEHYRKVFTGCDVSETARITYEPIRPKICIGDTPSLETGSIACGTCNPGMYKSNGRCIFCPSGTYSNGTSAECLPCASKLSLVPGLYYKNWNELPMYLNRSYMAFDDVETTIIRAHNQSWIPSINYITSQALPDALSVLSLTIDKGFQETDIAKTSREYGTLSFKFSIQCQLSCSLFLVAQDIFKDNDDDWVVLSGWKMENATTHEKIIDYTYSIQHSDPIVFSWLFTSDDTKSTSDEIRIYEIRVTNTISGGSDRCVSCLTTNNEKIECQSCLPGQIQHNSTCISCPPSTIAGRVRPHDPVPTVCFPCPSNTISDDGVSCYVPCRQNFGGATQYDLTPISTMAFHGSKLFTQKGSGYFHVFNASICGQTSATCTKTPVSTESKRQKNQMKIDSKLCRMGSVPDKSENVTSVAYIDDFGEQLANVSLTIQKYFPALRSDYNLTDITLVYRANASNSQSCSEYITHLSLRCDHSTDEDQSNSSSKYELQAPNGCATGTCDGCTFYFLLRTPLACPICDQNDGGYRTFIGPCKFGRQEVRKIPHSYCAIHLSETVETRSCSMFSIEIQIVIGLFIIIGGILIALIVFCWRKNQKLEYRYMQLIENNNPDDDTAVDNVCAQLSDEDDSAEEVQFQAPSKAKRIMNVVRNAIGKNSSNNGRSNTFNGDSFLLNDTSTNEA